MDAPKPFRDRIDAGDQLAAILDDDLGRGDVVVLGLARGGVPVAARVAEALGAPLDVFLVRKLGVPGREELAFGAIASGGARVLNDRVVRELEIADETMAAVAVSEQRELERRELLYRGGRDAEPVADRTAILVDDGLATGASMRAAVLALRRQGPAAVVVAVPVAAPAVCAEFGSLVDRVVCARTPAGFYAVGSTYRDFSQVTDEEVCALLLRRAPAPPSRSA
jgi:predicted phosphoribosyltransferase